MKNGAKEITVTFNTLTPIWTGDAWGKCKEIKSSSLIGSLRFWFEVICYFSKNCSNDDLNEKTGRFEKEVDKEKLKKCLLEKGNSFEAKIECLTEQGIPLPSIISGTTNWKSLIKIKKVTPIGDYCFGNKLNLPYVIAFSKKKDLSDEVFDTEENWKARINTYKGRSFKEKLQKAQEDYSFFFFTNPYFYGKFLAIFEVEENILEAIFYPLLNFMNKYGFWGGKWNIGYGRLKVEKIEKADQQVTDWEKDVLKFSIFGLNDTRLEDLISIESLNRTDKAFKYVKEILNAESFYCETEKELKQKISDIPKQVKLLEITDLSGNYKNVIRELLKIKTKIRTCLRGNSEQWKSFRHKLLGELGEGSKVLPYISENKTGFLSIAGLLNLKGEGDG